MSTSLLKALDEIEAARHPLIPKQAKLVQALSRLNPSAEQLVPIWYLLPAYAADSFPISNASWTPPMALSVAQRNFVGVWHSDGKLDAIVFLYMFQFSPNTDPIAFYSASISGVQLSGHIPIQGYDLDSISLSDSSISIHISSSEVLVSHNGIDYKNTSEWLALESRHSWIMNGSGAVSVWMRTNPGAIPDKFFLQILMGASRLFNKPRVETRLPCWELIADDTALQIRMPNGTYQIGSIVNTEPSSSTELSLAAPWGGDLSIGLYWTATGIRLTCKSSTSYDDCIQQAIRAAGASSYAGALTPGLAAWESAPSFLLALVFFGLPMLILLALALVWIRERWPKRQRRGLGG